MKTLLQFLLAIISFANLQGQIITPQIKANFGIDADLKANYFNGAVLGGNDEWFSSNYPGTGIAVIDTTGAAAIVAGYVTNPASRNFSFARSMSFPSFSVVNTNMLIDAVFVRDFHGDDSTVYAAGSNKNGQNPNMWSCPVSQSIPDKNEILDVFMHVRRGGTTAADSLWMFGAVSIENVRGNRYFDFEMYQTDIFYDRSTHSFSGYGPDAGHTSWKFDAAGNITQPGDIILTAEYGSSSLTMIEARIWIDSTSLSVTPLSFNWSGKFDGANNGARFGYASILPNTAGPFYSGLQSIMDTWGGPFKIVLGNNIITDAYIGRQFMEFSVNLSKLGLDPVTLLGGSTCDRPFQKVLVKTRASTSFTAELKDFVGPFDFFNAPKVQLFTDVPMFCGVFGVSNLKVINPLPTSTYTWTTIDGHFSDISDNTSVYVDAPGTYIVTQKLQTACPIYARDTITIPFDPNCGILAAEPLNFAGRSVNQKIHLSWKPGAGNDISYYDIARSTDGIHFYPFGKINAEAGRTGEGNLSIVNDVQLLKEPFVYYRLAIVSKKGERHYSPVIKIDLAAGGIRSSLNIIPNPVKDAMRLNVFAATAKNAQVKIYDATGKLMHSSNAAVHGNTVINLTGFKNWEAGIYTVKLLLDDEVLVKTVVFSR